MAISFPAIPLPFLPPLYYADIVPAQAPFSSSLKCLLIGQKNTSGATGQDNVPVLLSGSEADRLFGRGSMLARMYATARNNAPFAEFWGMSVPPQDGAIAAQGFIKVLVNPTVAGILNLGIAGHRISVPVGVGTAATQAGRLRNAINSAADCPVTAAIDPEDTAKVILTCKWRGNMGNQILITKGRLGVSSAIDSMFQITSMIGVTVGVGNMVLAGGLAALGNRRFDVFASPTRPGSDFMDGIAGRWSPLQQLYGHWFTSIGTSLAGLVTTGMAMNDPHLTVVGAWGSPSPSWEWAAAVAAHATAQWAEPPNISRPLQTLKLRGIYPPWHPAHMFSIAEQQSLLNAGISTYIADDFGEVHIGRLVTTRRVNDWGDPDPSWRDAVTMFQTMYFSRRMRAAITGAFPRAALTTRDSGIPGFASPERIKDLYIQEYMQMERLGLVENSELFARALIVERNAVDPNRVDSLIRPDFVNQLRIVANLIETNLELQSPTVVGVQ